MGDFFAWLFNIDTPIGQIVTTLVGILIAWLTAQGWLRLQRARFWKSGYSLEPNLPAAVKAGWSRSEGEKELPEGKGAFIFGIAPQGDCNLRALDIRPKSYTWLVFTRNCTDADPIRFVAVKGLHRDYDNLDRVVFEKRKVFCGIQAEMTVAQEGLLDSGEALWLEVQVEATAAWVGVLSVRIKNRDGSQFTVRRPLTIRGDHNALR